MRQGCGREAAVTVRPVSGSLARGGNGSFWPHPAAQGAAKAICPWAGDTLKRPVTLVRINLV